MRIAISYSRFSSVLQGIGSSENRQEENAIEFCKRFSLRLDNSLAVVHRGISGHKVSARERLQAFLDNASVFRGCVLVIEAIDRFSREDADDAYEIFRAICKSGIDIGIVEMGRILTYADLSDIGTKITLILKMCAANEFSLRLSARLKYSHKQRKLTGRTKSGKRSRICPKWVSVNEAGEYYLNAFADTLRSACLLSIAGHGARTIGKMLSIDGKNLPIVFRSRNLIGANDYPALLTNAEFAQLQAALQQRGSGIKVQRQERCTNLFSMLVDCSGDKLVIRPYKMPTGKRGVKLVAKACEDGKAGSNHAGYDYPTLERGLLRIIAELPTDAVSVQSGMIQEQLAKLESELQSREASAEQLENEAMSDMTKAKALSGLIVKNAEKMEQIRAEIERLKMESARDTGSALQTAKQLISELSSAHDTLSVRIRLKALITSLVKRVEVRRLDNSPRILRYRITLASGKEI